MEHSIESHRRRVNNLCSICDRFCAIIPKQKKNVYTDLKETIIKQTQTLTNNPFLKDKAHTIQIIFDDLNSAFRTVHKFITPTAPIDDSSLPDIQTAIDNYMTTYRRMSHNKVIPKQHLLEHHCIPHIRKHKFGLGLLGEQGTENSHQLKHI